jgi:Fe-S-cluster containining protein
VLLLAQARYRCTGCGDCCRGWDVPLEAGEADQFRKMATGLVPADRLRTALGRAKHAGHEVETVASAQGQCVALADDQRCLIHAQHGGDAKPRACRIFPFTFVATPAGVRVGLSFACPAVVDGEGPPLEEQRGDIEATFASAVDGTRYLLRIGDRVALAEGQELAFAEAASLVDALVAALDEDGPLAHRVCRVGALAALVQARLAEGQPFAAAFAAARAGRDALVDEALAEPPEVDRLSRALHRTLLKSTEPGRQGTAGRLGGAMASLFGSGEVRLRDPSPGAPPRVVPWREAERVAPGLGAAGEALVARWLGDSLRAFTFFGDAAFGLSLAGGLDLKVLCAAVAAFLARANAAAAGRRAVELDDVKRALRQLDAGITHRSSMPPGFGRALAATASLDLLREQLGT